MGKFVFVKLSKVLARLRLKKPKKARSPEPRISMKSL